MSGLAIPNHNDWYENLRAYLRDKYLKGTATPEEEDRYWIEAIKDPEETELLETEVNLNALFETQKLGRN